MASNYSLIIAKENDPEDKSSWLELWKQPNDNDLAELLVRANEPLDLARNYVAFVRENPEYLPPVGGVLELLAAQEKYSKTWSKQVTDQEKIDFASETTRLIFPQLNK